MPSPGRIWLALPALAATAVALTLVVTAGVEILRPGLTRPPAAAWRPLAIPRVDVHQHVGPETLSDAVRLAEVNGIRALVNLSGGGADGELPVQLAAARRHAGRVLVFMNLDESGCCGAGWASREAERLARGRDLGARGLKIYKSLGLALRDETPGAGDTGAPLAGRVPVDSPLLDPIWEACAALGLPVSIHSGDPRAFFEAPGPGNERAAELEASPEWSYGDRSRFPPWRQVFDEHVRLVERHPRVTFIGAHFGNDAEDPAEVARLLQRLPNLHVDTAARVPELGRRAEATRLAILAHPDRVLFGTDLQWIEGPGIKAVIFAAGAPGGTAEMRRFFEGTWRFFETRDGDIPNPTPIQGGGLLQGLGLSREVLEMVYHRNAERLLGIPPPPEEG